MTDSYSLALYALPVAKLDNLPAPDLDATTGMPTGNYVVKMGHYIESLSAVAIAEYRGTSHAWATSFSPPPQVQYPCTTGAALDGGTAIDGGRQLDGAAADGGRRLDSAAPLDVSLAIDSSASIDSGDSGSQSCLR